MKAIVYTKEDFKKALKSGADEICISGPYANEMAKKFSMKNANEKPEKTVRNTLGATAAVAAIGIAAPAVAAFSVPALLVAGPVGAAVASVAIMRSGNEVELSKGYVVVSYSENALYLKKR